MNLIKIQNNLNRASISIDPVSEWRQMYLKHGDYNVIFSVKNMSGINWKIHKRYYKINRQNFTRSEFSDLVWRCKENCTSHCYEFGGDYKPRRNYNILD